MNHDGVTIMLSTARRTREQTDDWDVSTDIDRLWLLIASGTTRRSVHAETGKKIRTVSRTWRILTQECARTSTVCPKEAHFYLGLKYKHIYISSDVVPGNLGGAHIPHVSDADFKEIKRAMYILSAALGNHKDSIMNWEDRVKGKFGAYNHGAHFDESFTHIWDGFPLPVWSPTNYAKDGQYVYSGKYKAAVFKGHLAITFWGGILACTGPHCGVDHDKRIWDDTQHQFPTLNGEWGLGDLAYESAARILTGKKHMEGEPWLERDEFMRSLIAHYRARVENVIRRIKCDAWCQNTFRGRYKLLVAFFNISVIMAAMEIRDEFEIDNQPMFEVVGPWPHKFY